MSYMPSRPQDQGALAPCTPPDDLHFGPDVRADLARYRRWSDIFSLAIAGLAILYFGAQLLRGWLS